MSKKTHQEQNIIAVWQSRFAFIALLITPTLTAAALYWKTQIKINDNQASVNERVTQLELKQEKTFVDKESFQEMQKDVKQLRTDMTEVKTLLRKKL